MHAVECCYCCCCCVKDGSLMSPPYHPSPPATVYRTCQGILCMSRARGGTSHHYSTSIGQNDLSPLLFSRRSSSSLVVPISICTHVDDYVGSICSVLLYLKFSKFCNAHRAMQCRHRPLAATKALRDSLYISRHYIVAAALMLKTIVSSHLCSALS